MHVALIQTAASLDPADNRARLSELCPPDADLVIFPEAYARDFGQPGTAVAPFAEPLDGPFATEVARVAAERDTTIVAGMFETSTDPERPFNTLLVRGAMKASYRKIHLYDSFGYRESDHLLAGPIEPLTFPLRDFTVGLLTCYDLRFPELARLLVDRGADVLVVPSAWVAGHRKVDHWLTLARARAIENTVYVVAVGQCGPRYSGHSAVIDPLGDVVADSGPDPVVLRATLDPERVRVGRETNPSLANRRL
jgi:deaminated glutathione amidase